VLEYRIYSHICTINSHSEKKNYHHQFEKNNSAYQLLCNSIQWLKSLDPNPERIDKQILVLKSKLKE
jgi:hypothetical protein